MRRAGGETDVAASRKHRHGNLADGLEVEEGGRARRKRRRLRDVHALEKRLNRCGQMRGSTSPEIPDNPEIPETPDPSNFGLRAAVRLW